MSNRIRLNDELSEMVRKYATAALPNHVRFGRTDDAVWRDIRLGKGGEVAYCLITGRPLELLSFDAEKRVDPGFDLVADGVRIDVKTTSHDLLRVNPEYVGCDRYALMRYHVGESEYELLAEVDKSVVFKHLKQGTSAWFIDLSADLESIARNCYIAANKQ